MKKIWTITFIIFSVVIMGIYCFNIMPKEDLNYKVKDLGGNKSVLENDKIVYKFPYNKYKMKKIIISKDGEKTKNVKCESKNTGLNEEDLKDKQFFRGSLVDILRENLYEDEKMKLYVCIQRNDSVTSNVKRFLKVYYRDKIKNKLKKFCIPLNLIEQNDNVISVYSKPYKDKVKVVIDLQKWSNEKCNTVLVCGTIDLKKEEFNKEKVIEINKEVILQQFMYGDKLYYTFQEHEGEKQVMINSITLDNYKTSREGAFESKCNVYPDLIKQNKMFFTTSLKNNQLDILCFDLDKKEVKKYNNIYLAENVKDIKHTVVKNIQLIDVKGNRAYFDISSNYQNKENRYRYINVVDLYKNKSLYFASVAEKIEDYAYVTVE
ncbi:hypothetical protein [Hathewaya limosa]|uniref:Lipoprotein n=1 Tax=Hathewaya limosa TaxID=1536 RepID=A0ABU0JPA0_HATLI|nr:hypothetical protein [Hathewaya limosa]MDQ0478908.1 hypothetical protein [Hathewaya limosa]